MSRSEAEAMPTFPAQPHAEPEQPSARLPLRLHLLEASTRNPVDGSWWPQSRDLAVELPDLIDHFPQGRGVVQRVVFSRPDWDNELRRVRVGHGQVKVGSYPHNDNHQVWLSMSTHELIRLSVHAHQPLAAPSNHVAPKTTEAPPRIVITEEPDGEAAEHWTDDGGSWWDSHRGAPSHRV